MYTELLEETDKKKELIQKLDEAKLKLNVRKEEMKNKSEQVMLSKRKLELM